MHPTAKLINRLALVVIVTLAPLHAQQGEYCWKTTYTRGVGTIPSDCSFDQQKQGLLCYPTCKAGYTGFVASCFQNCPEGFRDDGAACAKPAAYGRGAGYPWQIQDGFSNAGMLGRCQGAERRACEMYGAIAYPTCKDGFSPFGSNICSPTCKDGMTDIGVSCAKQSYTRPTITAQCKAGEVYDTGLCYPACKAGYEGAGPVCWGKCGGATPFECGGGCAKNQTACAQHTSDMVIATISSAINLGSFALPGVGGVVSAAWKTGIKAAGVALGKAAVATGGTVLSKQAIKQSILQASATAKVPIKDESANTWAEVLGTLQNAGAGNTQGASDFIGSLPFDPGMLDITGLSGVLKAYTHPVCAQ